jgi:thiamine biosynthesis protein ThiI
MQFIIKYFPEITIKSKPVRARFSNQLANNLRSLLKTIDADIKVKGGWDKLTVYAPNEDARIIEVLKNTPGIAYFLEVLEFPLGDMDSIYEHTAAVYAERLKGKTFAMRCKRAGKSHDFKSGDVERYVGGQLNQNTEAAGVKLTDPDVTVRVEIRDDQLFVVRDRYAGLGGFPLGTMDSVLSLISGGFDSTVSTYLATKRGLTTHFCFFNLGGREHEIAVKEVAMYLWMKFGASHRVKFVAVPFEGVVAEILRAVDNSQMGVVLKRMMLRAAAQVADEMDIEALVTGEAVGQVSSQTLTNLSVIDGVTDKLVLRPLIMMDKVDIIQTAAEIGTEDFSKHIPEYCGVISDKPTTRARIEKILKQEARFDFAILDAAVANREVSHIDEMVLPARESSAVEELVDLPAGAVVIDIRHPDEIDNKPLALSEAEVLEIPFYALNSRFAGLADDARYYLYCDKGIMSKLHASHLREDGHENVGVYRP